MLKGTLRKSTLAIISLNGTQQPKKNVLPLELSCCFQVRDVILPWTTRTIEGASLVAQTVKHLPAMWETRLQFLGWEDPLEKEMATHSSLENLPLLPGKSHGRRNLIGYNPWGHKESDTTEQLHFPFLSFPNVQDNDHRFCSFCSVTKSCLTL